MKRGRGRHSASRPLLLARRPGAAATRPDLHPSDPRYPQGLHGFGWLQGFGQGLHGFGWLHGFAQGLHGLGWLQGLLHAQADMPATQQTSTATIKIFRSILTSSSA